MDLRVVLIGAGDIQYHYFNLLNFDEKNFEKSLNEISKILSEEDFEIVLLPDRGVSFEIAKKYKFFNGKKVLGTVPLSDKDFGIKHLEKYMSFEFDGKKVFDEFIDTGNWYKQDLTHCIFGDIILMLGNSLGSMGELVYGFYLYKLFRGDKPNVKAKKKAIHEEVRAGENIPYSLIIYEPFVKEKLNYEIEEYIKKHGGKIFYVKNSNELKNVLKELKSYNKK